MFTGKYLCCSLFLIKNFKATLLKRDSKKVFPSEYCGIFKITCFEEHLQTAASISCYFDTINLKQSGFLEPILLKFLFKNENIDNYEIPWFYQEFKSENLQFLDLYSAHAARILDLLLEIMLSSPK